MVDGSTHITSSRTRTIQNFAMTYQMVKHCASPATQRQKLTVGQSTGTVERSSEIAVKRLRQEVFQFEEPKAEPEQMGLEAL
jgi:transposase